MKFKPGAGVLWVAMLLLAGCATNPFSDASDPVTPAPVATSTPTAGAIATPAPDAIAATSAQPATADPLADTQVIPGERIGPITQTTTRQDLATLLGEAALTDQETDVGEGLTEPSTVVNLGPERSLTVVWTDETRTRLSEVRNLGSAWKTPQGIGVGSTFAELQQKLGQFQLYGFEWDYGGTLVLEGSRLAQYEGLLILRVAPAENAPETAADAYQAVLGEELYASTDPNFQPLDLKVNEMIVYLTRPES